MSRERADSDTLTIDLTLDLSQPAARAAFEGAIVGDFSGVKALAASADRAGLTQYRVEDRLVNDLTYALHFEAFKTLSYDRASNTR